VEPDKGPGVVGSGAGGCVGCGGIDWVCDCAIVGAFGGNSSSESSESDNISKGLRDLTLCGGIGVV